MKVNIKDAPPRSETIIRNIIYAVRATAIMTEYYLRSFPVVFFYVLVGFALAFDSTGVPLATLLQQGMLTKEVAIKWSAAPDMTPQTVLYRRPVAQFSNFQPKIVSSWLILALFQANFLISGRSRLCPYQLVNSNQVRQGE